MIEKSSFEKFNFYDFFKKIFIGVLFLLVSHAQGQISNFLFSRNFYIQNINTTTYNNVQVLLTVNTAALISAGKMLANGNDMRFTLVGGNTILWHYVESGINTTNTRIWVKVPVLQGLNRTGLTMYYGNGAATNVSNGDSTFIFFDDFSGTTLNTTKWTNIFTQTGVNIVDSSGEMKRFTGSGYSVITSRNMGVVAPFIVTWRTNGLSAFSWDLCGAGYTRDDQAFTRYNYFSGLASRTGSGFTSLGSAGSISSSTQLTTTSCDTFYDFTSRVYANGACRIFHPRGSDTIGAISGAITNATRLSYMYFYNSGNATGTCSRGRIIDNVFVRTFVQNEPILDSIGNEITVATFYYSKNTGRLDSLGSWGTNSNGSGNSPISFNEPNSFYFVTNNNNPTIENNWFVTGNNTAIIVTGGYNLNIPNNLIFGADSVVLLANGTLTLNGNIFANKAFFDTLSNAQFTSNSPQNIPGFNYFNLITSGGAKTLLGNATARNSLTLLANLNTANFGITFGSSANQTGSINIFGTYIIGKLTRWFNTATQSGVFLYPVGLSGNYLPAQLVFAGNISNGGTISCEFISGNPGNGGLPLFDFTASPVINVNKAAQNGVWRIEAANGLNMGSTNYNLTLNANGFWGVNNFADLRIIRRPVNGSWQLAGSASINSGSNASPLVNRTGLNVFGDFTLGGDIANNPLPVVLSDFYGKPFNNKIDLFWQTSSEINTSHFEIEKLLNDEYTTIGNVVAKGNSLVKTAYSFVDLNILPVNQYRLKLIDLDGSYEYSYTILINGSADVKTSIFPNPANSILNIETDTDIDGIYVYDMNGKLVLNANKASKINISSLENGFYLIEVLNSFGSTKLKFIKN